MGSARQNQAPIDNTTASLRTEEESLTTNTAATAIPFGVGQMKTTLRWLTPIYNQRTEQVAAKTGKKG